MRRGSTFEQAVCEYLAAHGQPYAERRARRGRRDAGDVAGVPGWVLEVKAEKRMSVAGAVDVAERERLNAGVPYAASVLKRRMRPTSEAYVVMPLHRFATLLDELDRCCREDR